MKKLLITGASGFVGCRVVARWRNEYAVFAPSHAELDITDRESVDSYFLQHTPDVVVHLAALSNTGYCEQNPDESYRVNVEGAANIARAAALCRAKLIFFSSDQVYNGNIESGLLSEDVPVAPENVYGRHKLEAEERVLYFNPNTVVLRATWMYGR
jgi:dTDP-4-dehydrorhamnose reductase